MTASRLLSNVEREFMINALELGLRIDGRRMNTVREMKIEFGAKTGTIEVCLGRTRVLCRVVHELGAPRPDKPNEGVIGIHCTFPKYYQDMMSNDEIDAICLMIKAGLYESNAIDLESLCVLNGRKVWVLHCHLSVIQHDGNIIDCANLATLCALKHHRRPDVTVVGSKISVHSMADRHPISLSIHHLPICVTLAHVLMSEENEKHNTQNASSSSSSSEVDGARKKPKNKSSNADGFYTFSDPSLKEEKLMAGKTVYCMTKHNQLCAIEKIGGVAMLAKSFLSYIDKFVMGVVQRWSNQIENKFIQYQYQQSDALTRKLKLSEQVRNPIDVFAFGENKGTDVNMDNDEDVLDDNLLMMETDDVSTSETEISRRNKIWNDWETKEKIKLQTIRSNLTEKRISNNKSMLTSEFQ